MAHQKDTHRFSNSAVCHALIHPIALSPDPTPVDDLIRRCQFSASAVASVLMDLELAGRIETLPGNRVALLVDA